MGRLSGMVDVKHLRQRFLVGLGAALFALGAVILSMGLIAYFDEDGGESAKNVVTEPPGAQNLEHMPAVPFNPQPEVMAPEPTPEPAAAPLRIVIESLGVDAAVVEMGLDAQGVPHVPLNGQDVAWYSFSSPPGAGSNAVFAGHINWEGASGVFGALGQLEAEDTIRLISEDGREYTYKVVANFAVDPYDEESLNVMDATPTDTVTLITCGGAWVPDPNQQFGGSYTDRTIVQARLTDSILAAPVPAAVGEG